MELGPVINKDGFVLQSEQYRLEKTNFKVLFFLFTKLPWPGDSERTFRSSSQAVTCPPVYHTRRRLHTVPLIAERLAGKL